MKEKNLKLEQKVSTEVTEDISVYEEVDVTKDVSAEEVIEYDDPSAEEEIEYEDYLDIVLPIDLNVLLAA